jgi:hypothetical protein
MSLRGWIIKTKVGVLLLLWMQQTENKALHMLLKINNTNPVVVLASLKR